MKSKPAIWLKSFATSLASYRPVCFTLNSHLHPTNLWSCGQSSLLKWFQTPMSNIFLNSRQIDSCHFSLAIKSGSYQASWKLCCLSRSDIVLVTKAISCNHSFKVFSSCTSANAFTSGSDLSDCLVLLHLVQFDFLFLKQLAHNLPLQQRVLLALLLEVE